MRVNDSIVVETGRLFFVPYCSIHVPKYHQWMLNEDLRSSTSSDLLSLEEVRISYSFVNDRLLCAEVILSVYGESAVFPQLLYKLAYPCLS
ncbi:hypothetical protein PHET_11276 [Paragonimus heterotremus]|uniref:N-acetyltransferase domain-containing protein n=1 Tax=Paragonimus heterotremus TaxID=100268 RepID=A0A8J4SJK8_9TREM|nr:hypothetical protein PHET_11276 [Paragonimus heterotremus]